MNSTKLLALGVAGFFAYKWWKDRAPPGFDAQADFSTLGGGGGGINFTHGVTTATAGPTQQTPAPLPTLTMVQARSIPVVKVQTSRMGGIGRI